MDKKAFVGVIIPAAGSGARMGGVYKPMEKLCGREMIAYSLETFEKCSEVAFVVISAREDKVEELKELCKRNGFSKVKKIVVGGSDRQTSVENAFNCGLFDNDATEFVAVHDAARPLFDVDMAKKAFADALVNGNAVCASRVRDTVKHSDKDCFVDRAVDRDNLWLVQTPQIFKTRIYENALKKAKNELFCATDESSLVSSFGEKVFLCETPSYNIKITYPEDVYLAESILLKRGKKV